MPWIALLFYITMSSLAQANTGGELSFEQNQQAKWFSQDRPFEQNIDGIVNDLSSGLRWQQRAVDSQLTWEGAKSYCASLELAHIQSWRLPTRLELLSLLNYDNIDSAYDSARFNGEPTVAFWSATVYDNMQSHVWIAQFGEGDMYCLMRVAQAHVRCVA